jgi:hypothetical protein
MTPRLAALTLCLAVGAPAASPDDGALLREHVRKTYPSLAYVERYRRSFPAEIQGDDSLWSATKSAPRVRSASDAVRVLASLQDHHVSLSAATGTRSESLGVLFRTATDGSMVVWRVFDRAISGLTQGDVVVAVDGMPTARWLTRVSPVTFGGNRRSRVAKAALELGLGTTVAHATAKLAASVTLKVKTGASAPRNVVLPYAPMSEERAAAMTAAINSPDLPRFMDAGGTRIGSVRIGAFAPQYDAAFVAASEEAEKVPGTSEDQAMIAGFCAVVKAFIADVDTIAGHSDVLVLDLRGNFGGFGREARLLGAALSFRPLPKSFDVFPTSRRGSLELREEPDDPACGHVATSRPMIVLTDAGTRSSGELMAAWLWHSGAIVVGERTIGAGGGLEFNSEGFTLPSSGLKVRMSENFTVFDGSGTLANGEFSESRLVDLVSQNGFAPDRARPFAIQAAGLRPDLDSPTTIDDLRDGGLAQIQRAVLLLRRQGRLPDVRPRPISRQRDRDPRAWLAVESASSRPAQRCTVPIRR